MPRTGSLQQAGLQLPLARIPIYSTALGLQAGDGPDMTWTGFWGGFGAGAEFVPSASMLCRFQTDDLADLAGRLLDLRHPALLDAHRILCRDIL